MALMFIVAFFAKGFAAISANKQFFISWMILTFS
jgi:hypothetical protein